MGNTNRATLTSIQALRAIAAVLVVFFHTVVHLEARNIIPEIPYGLAVGRSGVDMFFVISGFIMVYVTRNSFQKKGSSFDFMARRIIRIVPIYWFYTLVLAALLTVSPSNFSDGKVLQPDHLFTSLAFIAWPNSAGDLKPVLQAGWTLDYEMYFYLVIAIFLQLPGRFFLYLLTALFLGSIGLGALLPGLPPPTKVMTSPLLLEFLMGCVAGVLYLKRDSIPYPGLLILIGVLGLISTTMIDTSTALRWVKWGFPSFLIVLGAVFWEKRESIKIPKILVTLGDSSYSLYLTHLFSINLTGFIWHRFIGDYYGLFYFTAILCSVIAGHIAYLLIEKPVTQYLSGIYRDSTWRRHMLADTV